MQASTLLHTVGLALGASAMVSLVACTPTASTRTAGELAASMLIVDTHIDAPIHAVMAPDRPGDFDLARARAGGLDVAFMSIFVPSPVDERGEGPAFADKLIDWVDASIDAHPDGFARATCVADVHKNRVRGLVSLAFGLENGGPLATSPNAVDHFRSRGIRYVTLAHGAPNALADSSYSAEHPNRGLSAAGKALVARLNELGIMVDVSHVSDEAFWQTLAVSEVPVIASHSAARRFTPGFERNMSDEMIVALARKNGVVQVNFGSAFVTRRARAWTTQRDREVDRAVAVGRLVREPAALASFNTGYVARHPFPFAAAADVVDHIEHIVRLVGIDHVGLGSDFDGVGDTLPVGLKDVAAYPNLIAELTRRGYAMDEIARVLGENLLRVWAQVEDFARQRGNPPACSQS